MKIYKPKEKQQLMMPLRNLWRMLSLLIFVCGYSGPWLLAQSTQPANQDSVPEQIQKLTEAMAKAQSQLEQSQHQLDEMRQQLAALQRQMAQAGPPVTPPHSHSPSPVSSC